MDDKRITRRKFVAVIATGTAALALPGCSCDGTHGEGPDGGTPDGGRPPPSVTPAWRAGKAVGEWVEIPNSQLSISPDVPDSYFADLGLEIPSQRPAPNTNMLNWGTNSKGLTSRHSDKWSYGGRYYGYHGMAMDSRDSRIFVGGGDAGYPENAYHCLNLERDIPRWTSQAIKGSHSRDYKNTSRIDGSVPPASPGEYDLYSEHYDGRPRGGHMYWNQEIVTGYNGADLLVHWASNQFYPADGGNDARVRTANLVTREYEQGPSKIVASLKYANGELIMEQDSRPWKQQHPVTQDQYMIRGDQLYAWRKATNTYQVVYDFQPVWGTHGVDNVSMSINWEENYILCEGWVASGHGTRAIFVLDLSTPQGTNLATKIDVAQFDGPGAAAINLMKYGGIVWCPDLHKFVRYKTGNPDTANAVYSVERTSANKFYADVVVTTGTPSPILYGGGDGGMLNRWRYVPRLKIMVAHFNLNYPMYALVTA